MGYPPEAVTGLLLTVVLFVTLTINVIVLGAFKLSNGENFTGVFLTMASTTSALTLGIQAYFLYEMNLLGTGGWMLLFTVVPVYSYYELAKSV